MKKLTPVILFLLVACQKEIEPPSVNDAESARRLEISRFSSKYVISTTSYNPCTGEDMLIEGPVEYRGSIATNGNTQYYTYFFHYDSVRATGMLTGQKYKGSGYIIDVYKAIWNIDYNTYVIKNEWVANKIKFSIPGSNNDLVTNILYHIYLKDGQIVLDQLKAVINACN